jgi:thioesterase domain-containing protein
LLFEVPISSAAETAAACERARIGWIAWRETSMSDRFEMLERFAITLELQVIQPRDSPRAVAGFNDYFEALRAIYRMRTYPGHADFFLSRSVDRARLKNWRYRVRDSVRVHDLDAEHLELLRPSHAQLLADALAKALREARERETGRT